MTDKVLKRTMFETSRVLEYFTERELSYQTGHNKSDWPLVILKELMDNALDACENASIAPEIKVELHHSGEQFFTISVEDNGLGIQPEVITKILNFQTRTSDKEAYVSPTRGAQGNALKTAFAIPYVLSTQVPQEGTCEVESMGIRHIIRVKLDMIKQQPRIEYQQVEIVKKAGFRFSCSRLWMMSIARAGGLSRVSSLILSGGSSRILRLFLGRGPLLGVSSSGTPPQQQVAVPVPCPP